MDEGTLGADKLHKARLCERSFLSHRVWNNGSDRGTKEITEKTCTISFSLCVRPLSRFCGIECVLNIRKWIRYPLTPKLNEMLSREHAHAR